MRFLRAFLCSLAFAEAASGGVFAFDLSLSASGTAQTGTSLATQHSLYPDFEVTASHQGGDFNFLYDFGMDGSGQYGSIFGGSFGFTTIFLKQGGVSWANGAVSASLGKFALRDEVDSPYSLALSSEANTALTGVFGYEDDKFFYYDRWFALNYDSSGTFIPGNGLTPPATPIAWPDRSTIIKSYGLKMGDLRLGFQDIIVFTNLDYGSAQRGPLFDLEYFINPVPAFLVQYALTSMDSPWEKNGTINDNSLMGFYGTWKRDSWKADAQFLIDDFDLNAIVNPTGYQNPSKIAWTFGASLETDYGTFRFDHAGATRYTFEASGYGGKDNLAYGYTYYPDTEFLLGSSFQAIDPESNYVGYLHGENNIAFMGSWSKAFGPLSATASLEFTLSGSKSPANPWGTDTSYPTGTVLLNDPVLEKKVVLGGSAEYTWKTFRFFASAKLGYIWNRLELAAVAGEVPNSISNGLPYYSPSSDNAFVGAITIGGAWTLKY